jgi:toxin YhaV
VNDASTKRAHGSKADAYAVFGKMLDSGHPPDGWNALLEEAERAGGRLGALTGEDADR